MLGSTCRDYRSFCFLFSLKAPLSVAGTSSVNDNCLLTVARKELQLWALSVQCKEQAFQRWTRPLEIQRIVVVQHNITHEGGAANEALMYQFVAHASSPHRKFNIYYAEQETA
jgi:hypothetical protein